MQLPQWLARFNRHITNPIQRIWAGYAPTFVILLSYGPDRDWLKNITAAGGGPSSPGPRSNRQSCCAGSDGQSLAVAKLGISSQTSTKGDPMSYSGAKDQADRAMTKAAEAGRSTDGESQRLLAEAVGHLAMALSAIALELQHSE
jgi:hypothetical protein